MIKRSTPLHFKGDDNKILPFLLKPACKDYLWGGDKLAKSYGKNFGITPLAETWECSVHPDGISLIDTGPWEGTPLDVLLKAHPEILGVHPQMTYGNGELPILIKLIDAGNDASIQVHPDDEYAAKHENGANGKAEMWYVLEAEEDSKIVYGFYQKMDKTLLKDAIAKGDVEKYLQKVPVKKDDVFFVEPGQVHAIGSGIVLAEIQQNSNLTYRLYDYNRKDKNGNLRELHVEKALDVAKLDKNDGPRQPMRVLRYQPGCATELLCRCKYFQVERVLVNIEPDASEEIFAVGKDSFLILLCTEGCGEVITSEKLYIKKGDCVFLPADCGAVKLAGTMQVLKIRC